MSWLLVQPMTQVVLAVGFDIGVLAFCVVIGTESAIPGTKQPVWQLAAVELHDIMQLVTVDV